MDHRNGGLMAVEWWFDGHLPSGNQTWQLKMHENSIWVCLKMLFTPKPNGFADHYPVFKWLFHWEYTLFSDKPLWQLNGGLMAVEWWFDGSLMVV